MTNYLKKQLGMGEVCSRLSILRCQSFLGSWQCRVQVFGCVEHQGGRTFGRGVCLPHDCQETYKDEGNQSKPSKAYTPPPPGTHFLQLSLTSQNSTSRRPIIHWKLEPVRNNWLENHKVLLSESPTSPNSIIRLWSHQRVIPAHRPEPWAPNHFLKVYQLETKPSMHESVWDISYLNQNIKIIPNNSVTLCD